MTNNQLSIEQAYKAMFHFLENIYNMGDYSIGGLLGSMQLLEDGTPADPAFWNDWLVAVEKVNG